MTRFPAAPGRAFPEPRDTLLLIDGHVHLHGCFALPRFLDAAARNFGAQAGGRLEGHRAGRVLPVLLLTEMAGVDAFGRLRDLADAGDAAGPWTLQRTGEPDSVEARSAAGRRIALVAGRQLVTSEGLEVLAVAGAASLPDGLPLADCVVAIREAGAVPVIPWGVGKWLGRRGRVLADFLTREHGPDLWLGDNAGRPFFWRRPRHFALAAARGVRVLPGTDPLPFAGECERPGSFGAAAVVALDVVAPAAGLRRLLRDPGFAPEPYGSLEWPLRFLRNQLAMQRAKRAG